MTEETKVPTAAEYRCRVLKRAIRMCAWAQDHPDCPVEFGRMYFSEMENMITELGGDARALMDALAEGLPALPDGYDGYENES